MNETKELLRRGVGDFEPMPDAFERVLVRRGRKRRNQRIAAGVLGIAVFALLAIVFVRAFDNLGRHSPAASTEEARISIEGEVSRIVAGEGAVWLLGSEGISKLDPATNAVVASFQVPGAEEIAIGDGSVWVSTPSQVVRLDADSGEVVARIDTASAGPMALGAGSLWLGQYSKEGPQEIIRIDVERNTVAATIEVRPEPEALVFTGGALWVEGTVPGVATIERIDPATNATHVVFEGTPETKFGLSYVSATAGAVWAIGCDESVLPPPTFETKPRCVWSVVRVDAATTETDQVRFAAERVVRRPNGTFAVEAVRIPLMVAGDDVWILLHNLEPLEGDPETELVAAPGWHETNQRLLRVDPQTGRVVDTIPLSEAARDAIEMDRDLWIVEVGADGSYQVVRIDPRSIS